MHLTTMFTTGLTLALVFATSAATAEFAEDTVDGGDETCYVSAETEWHNDQAVGRHVSHVDGLSTVLCPAVGELEGFYQGTLDECVMPDGLQLLPSCSTSAAVAEDCAWIRAGTHVSATGNGVWTGWDQKPGC